MNEQAKMSVRDMEEGVMVGKIDKCNNIGHPYVRLWADGTMAIKNEGTAMGWISAFQLGGHIDGRRFG